MKVTNMREIRQVFRRLDRDVQKALQRELRSVAAPVAATARELAQAEGMPASTVEGYKPRTSVGIAKVQQTRRRTTGQHPKYGSRQMRRVLIPALKRHAPERIRNITVAIDQTTGRFNRG